MAPTYVTFVASVEKTLRRHRRRFRVVEERLDDHERTLERHTENIRDLKKATAALTRIEAREAGAIGTGRTKTGMRKSSKPTTRR